MKDLINVLIKKIRLWNPKYFPNPFYSPSLAGIEASKAFLKEFIKGLEGKGEPTKEGWEMIYRSAKAAIFFDDEG